jgi:hypothetical protein
VPVSGTSQPSHLPMTNPRPVAAELCEADLPHRPDHRHRPANSRRSGSAPGLRHFRRKSLIIETCSTSATPPEPPKRTSNRRGKLPRAPLSRLCHRATHNRQPQPDPHTLNFCNLLIIDDCSTSFIIPKPPKLPRLHPRVPHPLSSMSSLRLTRPDPYSYPESYSAPARKHLDQLPAAGVNNFCARKNLACEQLETGFQRKRHAGAGSTNYPTHVVSTNLVRLSLPALRPGP